MAGRLYDNPTNPEAFCAKIAPGRSHDVDLTSSVMRPKTNFSDDFYATVYAFYAKQYSQEGQPPIPTPDTMTKEEFYKRIKALKAAGAVAPMATGPQQTFSQLSDIVGTNILLGEITHDAVTPKKFLVENMKALKAAGYTTIYIEHLFYDTHQSFLDQYNNHPDGQLDKAVSDRLEKFNLGYGKHSWSSVIKNQNRSPEQATQPGLLDDDYLLSDEMKHRIYESYREQWIANNFSAVVKAAHEAGLRVVAIDIKDIYNTQDGKGMRPIHSEDRIIMGDYCFAQIIQHDQEMQKQLGHHGNYVALIGATHVEGTDKLLTENVTTVMAGDEDNNTLKLNCRGHKIAIGSGGEKLRCLGVDVMFTMPFDDVVPKVSPVLKPEPPQ